MGFIHRVEVPKAAKHGVVSVPGSPGGKQCLSSTLVHTYKWSPWWHRHMGSPPDSQVLWASEDAAAGAEVQLQPQGDPSLSLLASCSTWSHRHCRASSRQTGLCGESLAQGWTCLYRTIYIVSCWGPKGRVLDSEWACSKGQPARALGFWQSKRSTALTRGKWIWLWSKSQAQDVSRIGNLHLARAPGT